MPVHDDITPGSDAGEHVYLHSYDPVGDNWDAVRSRSYQTAAIANGTTESDYVDGRGLFFFGLVIPAAFTGTSISFKTSPDASTFQALYNTDGTLLTVTVAQGHNYTLPAALTAWPFWRVVSGSAEAAGRTLIVMAKGNT